MANIREYFSRIKLVYRRSRNLTKIVVMAAIVLCTAALITLSVSTAALRSRTEAMRTKALGLEQANIALEERIQDLGSVQSVAQIAKEELGLVDPNTVIFKPVE